ncbi:hypothetical protein DJ568_12780 [Mucilaginibacter hurinus]|uniref:Uncharacterized protein n=1 Tax=Mucilaginibacter hurinus TaxID=2201324 RepID=A0A367GNA8_9SPHI|nr:hypothetical protein DJ568_12780 [Mucilaginibacter hurinus]
MGNNIDAAFELKAKSTKAKAVASCRARRFIIILLFTTKDNEYLSRKFSVKVDAISILILFSSHYILIPALYIPTL